MKKAILLALAFSLLLSPSAWAAPGSATLQVAQVSGYPASLDLRVPITLVTGPGSAVSAINFDLTYDPAILTFKAIEAGPSAIQADKTLASSQPATGVVRAVIYGLNQHAIADGVLAEAVFDVRIGAPVGSTPLGLENVTAADPEALAVDMTLLPGSVDIQASESPFVDVAPDHPYYGDITKLHDLGFVAGCSLDPPMYCPQNSLRRSEMAVFNVRGLYGADFSPPWPDGQVFADVSDQHWSFEWVHQFYLDGQTAGCGTDPLIFCPEDFTSRVMAAVYFLRVQNGADFQPPAPKGMFSDMPVDYWGTKWAEEAVHRGLMEPCNSQPLEFCPADPVTRAYTAHLMVIAKGLE
jgi:hypothetical protein